MRPGSPGRHLGISLMGVVFLLVFLRHLLLGDLFLFGFFVSPLVVSVVCFLCWVLWVLLFLLLLFLSYDHCGFLSWVSGSLVWFSCWFSWC